MGLSTETIRVLYKLSLFGLDVSITSAVLVIWCAVTIVLLLFYLAVRKPALIPGKIQSLAEVIYEFWESQTGELFQEQSKRWLPFIIALFCFVLACNLLALIPDVYPITANINTTVALALIVFFTYHLAGAMKYGMAKYLKSLVPRDVPIYIMPLILIIEVLTHLARPFSLAVRLFANMTAGHMVALTILSLIFVFNNIWLAGIPLLGRVAIGLFEVFVAFIQAYIFAYLAALYIGLAIQEEH